MIILDLDERWIPGYEQLYSIGLTGRVHSFYKGIKRQKALCLDKYGYQVVSLYSSSVKPKLAKVHRLVAENFVSGDTKLHRNGIKTDNTAPNLEWCTNSQNKQHAFDSGITKMGQGEDNPGAKLTTAVVLDILFRWHIGRETQRSIERSYNLPRGSVWPIVHKKSWRHISCGLGI